MHAPRVGLLVVEEVLRHIVGHYNLFSMLPNVQLHCLEQLIARQQFASVC